MTKTLKLQTDCLLHVPMQMYDKDFTFIVNSEKYKTSFFFADLISPIISSYHLIDPTMNEFVINTKVRGDFNEVINLINFKEEIFESDFAFICEVLDQIGTEKVEIYHEKVEITKENVIGLIKKHASSPQLFKKQLEEEIDFFSSNFSELKEQIFNLLNEEKTNKEKLEDIIEQVISRQGLKLESEDQLLEFINQLYMKDNKYSYLYEHVFFENVEGNSMKKFLKIFDVNDMTKQTWLSLSKRLQQPENDLETIRKHDCSKIEIKPKEKEFDGIINYFRKNSNIKDEVEITCSSILDGDPLNLFIYDNKKNWFSTQNEQNSWICFEFKNHKIIPENYLIRSFNSKNHRHPKSWVLEGSNNNENWEILDVQNNCKFLCGDNLVHLFSVSHNKQSFKYLRLRQTGLTSENTNHLLLNSIEFFGQLL